MNWRNPNKELPKDGEVVWVVTQHNKQHNPRSCEIFCGEVEVYEEENIKDVRINTIDFTGQGCTQVTIGPTVDSWYPKAVAWCYPIDLPMPEWMPHDPHWNTWDKKWIGLSRFLRKANMATRSQEMKSEKEEMRAMIQNLIGSNPVCDECKGKPDWGYFAKGWAQPIIICNSCKEVYESTIRSIASMYGGKWTGQNRWKT